MLILGCDLETSGLDPDKHLVLEAAFVLEDTSKPDVPVDQLPCFSRVIYHDNIIGQPQALAMHASFIADCGNRNIAIKQADLFIELFRFLDANGVPTQPLPFPSAQPRKKITLAGKNIGAFDLQFLRLLPNFGKYVRFPQRSLDPAILFMRPNDDFPPDQATCLERAGLNNTVTHRALDDARQVIELLRIGLHTSQRV